LAFSSGVVAVGRRVRMAARLASKEAVGHGRDNGVGGGVAGGRRSEDGSGGGVDAEAARYEGCLEVGDVCEGEFDEREGQGEGRGDRGGESAELDFFPGRGGGECGCWSKIGDDGE